MQTDDDTSGTRVASGAPASGRGGGVGLSSRSSRWEQLAPEGLLAGESSDGRLARSASDGEDDVQLRCARGERRKIGAKMQGLGLALYSVEKREEESARRWNGGARWRPP
jgi:hypothetical protein